MRAVLQRVKNASVSVGDVKISTIDEGLCIFLGITKDDTDSDINYIINKTLGLRIFNDESDNMNISIEDICGNILLISQFTLYGDCRKGRRPSFSNAMPPAEAELLFNRCITLFKERYNNIQTGKFGAHMVVDIVNDGPVTILLDSKKQF